MSLYIVPLTLILLTCMFWLSIFMMIRGTFNALFRARASHKPPNEVLYCCYCGAMFMKGRGFVEPHLEPCLNKELHSNCVDKDKKLRQIYRERKYELCTKHLKES